MRHMVSSARESSCVSIGLLMLVLGLLLPAAAQEPSSKPEAKSVRLTIDYGDGVEKHFTALEWKPSMTIADALELAQRHPRGIRIEQRGRGETAFLTQIDDLKNEGSNGRNWIFHVNDKIGDRSYALVRLEAGDVILWKFSKYR